MSGSRGAAFVVCAVGGETVEADGANDGTSGLSTLSTCDALIRSSAARLPAKPAILGDRHTVPSASGAVARAVVQPRSTSRGGTRGGCRQHGRCRGVCWSLVVAPGERRERRVRRCRPGLGGLDASRRLGGLRRPWGSSRRDCLRRRRSRDGVRFTFAHGTRSGQGGWPGPRRGQGGHQRRLRSSPVLIGVALLIRTWTTFHGRSCLDLSSFMTRSPA